jgi:hypothetical protein
MKTKTLLIAAATLAVGAITSQAQVYSQNIVGYVNIPETAGGLSLEAPPLDLDGTGTNNTLASTFPNPTIGDNVFTYNSSSSSFVVYQYLKRTTGVPPHQTTVTNWYDPNVVIANNNLGVINPGQGYFYNAAVNETNTYVGQVLLGNGSLTNQFVPSAGGFGIVSSQLPISGPIQNVLNYIPTIGDNVYVYSNNQYVVYQYLKRTTGVPPHQTTVTNWYDPNVIIDQPTIQVGQGFFLNPAVTPVWVQTTTNL